MSEQPQIVTPVAPTELTLSPFKAVRDGESIKLYYRDKYVGTAKDGDLQSFLEVIDIVTDRVLERARESMLEGVEKLVPELNRQVAQHMQAAVVYDRKKRGLLSRIFG